MTVDVLTFGEALLRLTPPGHRRLVQTHTLEMHIGGSELNTAVGLARMGLSVAWLSRLTDNALGRLIERTLLVERVDGSHITWTDADRIGTYYMEEGRGVRASQVIYDRAHSAISHIQPTDLDLNALLVKPPRLLHLTGITPALSQRAAATVHHLADACHERGVPLSFDLNYRAKLWDAQSALSTCDRLMQTARYLFIPARDAAHLLNCTDLTDLHARYPNATIIMTRGADGASAITPAGDVVHHPIFATETVCRVGGGDAFAAGFLYASLQEHDLRACLRYGAALAALKYSLPGDMPLVDPAQVHQLVQSGGGADIAR